MATTTATGADRPRTARGLLRPALAVWAVLAALATANGITRELVVVPAVGERAAHLLSTGVLTALVAAVATLFVARFGRRASPRALLSIGALWVVLTVGFEFVVGRTVDNKSWATLLADYNVLAGRVWIAVPLALLLTPVLAGRYLRRRS